MAEGRDTGTVRTGAVKTRTITRINGVDFYPLEGVYYKHSYTEIARAIKGGAIPENETFRKLVLNDLWFVVFFVLKVDIANHPFVVGYCREVEDGKQDYTIDLVAREHFKTTVVTKAEVIQRILRNPEERIAIFSHTRPAAKAFLRSVKLVFEGSEFLKALFPDILYQNPETQSSKWSEDDGLMLRRDGFYNESTLEAWGLLEGMPVGKHFTHRVYDDIETQDIVGNPDTVNRLKDAYDISQNLGTYNGTHRVVGTPYHYNGVLQYIKEMKDINKKNVYTVRLKPATDDGTINGRPVFLSQERIDILKINEYSFNCQQLLNPAPTKHQKLNPDYLKEISLELIPADAYKFMLIDPAGDSRDGKGDAWAMVVCAVEPKMDNIGASNVYITDAVIEPMTESAAIEAIARMYMANGIILKVCYEKQGNITPAVMLHVVNALKTKGRYISEESNSLFWLKHQSRNKEERITSALQWPLNNGKLHISQTIHTSYRDRLKNEMSQFPYWHDDGLDALSYLYDVVKDFSFQQIKFEPIKYKNLSIT